MSAEEQALTITIRIGKDRFRNLWKQVYIKNLMKQFYPKGDNQDYVSLLILEEMGITLEIKPPSEGDPTLKDNDNKELENL